MEGCIVNVANVVAVEGVVVGDAEDVPSSIVESVWLVVVVLVQVVFPHARSSFPRLLSPWFLVPGPWTRSTRDRRVTRRVSAQSHVSLHFIQHSDAYTCLLVARHAPPQDYPRNQTVTHRFRSRLLLSESDLRPTTLISTDKKTMANRPLAPLVVHTLKQPLPYQRLVHPPD